MIAGSLVPEDPVHAENTLTWLLKLEPDAGEALRIAALGHDIERAVEKRRIRKADFHNFDRFKAAHAANSATILAEILDECGVENSTIQEICRLVRVHETGGDERSDILKDADSLSFFEVNLPLYFARRGWDETKRRSIWGYRRLSAERRHFVRTFRFEEKQLNPLLNEVIMSADPRGNKRSQD